MGRLAMQAQKPMPKFRAIVLIGDEISPFEKTGRLLAETKQFIHYLEIHPRCKDLQIFHMEERCDVEHFVDYFKQRITDPLLILYHGHGSYRGHWSTDEASIFYYSHALHCMRNVSGPLLIINDCCFAGLLVKYIEKDKAFKRSMVGVIAACPANERVKPRLQERILDSWLRGRPYKAPEKVDTSIWQRIWGSKKNEQDLSFRWGARLDHYFI